MKVLIDTPELLVLRGRREDGEVGEQGLWLLWLVSLVALAGGAGFASLEEPDARLMGLGAMAAGGALGLFGLHRLRRRESLTLDCRRQLGDHSTWAWPGSPQLAREFRFDEVREVSVREELESPGSGHHGPSQAYPYFVVELLLPRRQRLWVTKVKSEEEARSLASRIEQALGSN